MMEVNKINYLITSLERMTSEVKRVDHTINERMDEINKQALD